MHLITLQYGITTSKTFQSVANFFSVLLVDYSTVPEVLKRDITNKVDVIVTILHQHVSVLAQTICDK